MREKNWMEMLLEKNQTQTLLQTNEVTQQYGLNISDEDAKLLTQERKDSLQEQQRIEFGEGILSQLIVLFCDSPYIEQSNYVETLGRLQDIFYLYKNESLDELTDEELLEYMKEQFDGVCQGSLEYLEETALEDFARNIRRHTRKYLGRYRKGEE